jgi:hypothetical protein
MHTNQATAVAEAPRARRGKPQVQVSAMTLPNGVVVTRDGPGIEIYQGDVSISFGTTAEVDALFYALRAVRPNSTGD